LNEVIVLQHAPCETLGTIENSIIGAQRRVRYVRSYAGDPVPDSIDSAAGLVVMGGPMGGYEQDRYPFLRQELRLIERTVAENRPVLGICLGSQLLATALGTQVRKGSRKEIGWHRVFLESAALLDPLFSTSPPEFDTFHWHGDVYDLPPGAIRLAHSEMTGCQAFRYAANVYGILFHMELTRDMILNWTDAFADELHEERIDAVELTEGIESLLARSQAVGHAVFQNWARMLASV
jgi:GMP synthase (glutamine-hydrolysing)